MTFNNYEEQESVEPRVFTDEEKKVVTDAYARGMSVTEIKHEYFYPTNLIKNSIRHKEATSKYVVELMNGMAIDTPMVPAVYEFNEETMENVEVTPMVEATYHSKPTTLIKLKEAVAEKFPECTVSDYNVDAIVTAGTNAGTWTAFKECF